MGKTNTITVTIDNIDGMHMKLHEVTPLQAIEKYFNPDSGLPSTVKITATDKKGKTVIIILTNDTVRFE